MQANLLIVSKTLIVALFFPVPLTNFNTA